MGLSFQASGSGPDSSFTSTVCCMPLKLIRPAFVFGLPYGGCRHVSGPCCPHGSQGYSYSSIRIFTNCQSLIATLSRGPAHQPDSVCISIWSHLSSISKASSIHIQWIPSYIGIPGNTLADLEAKQGSTLPQTWVPVDLATAKVLIWRTGQEEFQTCYKRDPHLATHRTLTGATNPLAHWRFGWTRSQCITVAQLRTGHCPLLASYLHHIGRKQSPMCPYCGGDDETAQHLLLCCPSHMLASTSTNYINSADPRRMWSFLESIGAVTRPLLTGNERERETDRDRDRDRDRQTDRQRNKNTGSQLPWQQFTFGNQKQIFRVCKTNFVNSLKTCRKIILGHRNFYLRINLKTLFMNLAPDY